MKTILYVVRHGQSTSNVQHTFGGCLTDSSLTRLGRKQGRFVSDAFKKIQIDAIYSSTLSRAETTATYTAKSKKMPVHIDERLREFSFGYLDGKPIRNKDTLAQEDVQLFFQNFTRAYFEGGEKALDCAKRMAQALTDIAKKHLGQTVAVFSHSISIGLLDAYLGEGDFYSQKRRVPPNASITTIVYDGERLKVEEFGSTGHLKGFITSAKQKDYKQQ